MQSTSRPPRPIDSWRHRTVATAILAAALIAAIAFAGCGSSSSSSGSTGSSAGSATSPSNGGTSKPASDEVGSGIGAAEKALAPYVGHPSPFPVDQPLEKPVPKGSKFVYLQCSTPVCAIFGELMKGAVETAGSELSIIDAGASASSSQAAASSALAMKPDVVFITGVQPSSYGDGLKKLSEAGAKVASVSVAEETEPFGITFNFQGVPSFELNGRLLADWVATTQGSEANVVFYTTPELNFTTIMLESFETELAEVCPDCSVRSAKISIATVGSTSAQTIVSDLQSHPETTTAVLGIGEAGVGLPPVLKAANISVATIGFGPVPSNLEEIKNGGMTAGLATDIAVTAWTAVDAGIRLMNGEPLTPSEEAGEAPMQILERPDITFDPSKGWTGYPEFAELFEKVWNPAS